MEEPSSSQLGARKAYSCVRCFERKIKCDKQRPCSVCLRSKAECVARIPAAPRRRARQISDQTLLVRLQHYEDLLRDNGIDFASPPVATSTANAVPEPSDDDFSTTSQSNPNRILKFRTLPSPGTQEGKLIVDHGRARFIENNLWASVSEELRHSKDVIPESNSEDEMDTPVDNNVDFVLGVTPSPNQTSILHPSPGHIQKLWQIFLTNVNPLTKIIHRPTLQRSIEECISNIEHVPRGLEPLMFAIYGAAVLSMRDGECQATFGDSRSTLLSRYQLGARRSLTRAQFMATSDLRVLQAFVIFLLTMRQKSDTRTLWALSGVAYRVAQGLGVHQDGAVLGLAPFETEMRRRLWWQINALEFNATELNGFGTIASPSLWSTKPPLNIDDEDIWPGMREAPLEHTGPTEMVACLIRYEVGNFWKRKLSQVTPSQQDFPSVMRHLVATATMKEKDEIVDEFEADLEEKFLKHCDPAIPIQMMASITGRIICKSKRIMVHHPRHYANKKDIPDSELEFLWTTSMALIEADNAAHSFRALQKFHWHIDADFHWQALILVLTELIARPIGDKKDDVWTQIGAVFQNHPNFISDHKRPLHIAIASLCLKAWQAREKAQLENPQGSSWLDTPLFVLQILKQREDEQARRYLASQLNPSSQTGDTDSRTQPHLTDTLLMLNTADDPQFQPDHTFDWALSVPMIEDMGMNWKSWDTLLNDLETPFIP